VVLTVPDFTATTIIERFQDEAAAASVERCLKKLASKKAKEILEVGKAYRSSSGAPTGDCWTVLTHFADSRAQAPFAHVHIVVPRCLPTP
jgi:hypothetical protein